MASTEEAGRGLVLAAEVFPNPVPMLPLARLALEEEAMDGGEGGYEVEGAICEAAGGGAAGGSFVGSLYRRCNAPPRTYQIFLIADATPEASQVRMPARQRG